MHRALVAAIGTVATAGTVGLGFFGAGAGHATAGPPSLTTMSTVGRAPAHNPNVIDVSRYTEPAFVTPTGHIACQFDDSQMPYDSPSVSCAFPDGPVHSTLPEHACGSDPYTYFHGISSKPNGLWWDCAQDLDIYPRTFDPNSAWGRARHVPTVDWVALGHNWGRSVVLPYGTTLLYRGEACTSHTNGIVCENLGHRTGFQLSSHRLGLINTTRVQTAG